MNYIDYINSTLTKKSFLVQLQQSHSSWQLVIEAIRSNEARYIKYKTIYRFLFEKVEDYRTGDITLGGSEIKQFHQLIVTINNKLNTLEQKTAQQISNDGETIYFKVAALKTNDGTYQAKTLLLRWKNTQKHIENTMSYDGIDDTISKIDSIKDTYNKFIKLKSDIEDNKKLLSQFLGVQADLAQGYSICQNASQVDSLESKLTLTIGILKNYISLEKEFQNSKKHATEEDADKIEQILKKAKKDFNIEQVKSHIDELQLLVSSIPIKARNHKILIAKVISSALGVIIFVILMINYVVPVLGPNIWVTPIILAALIAAHKKKIIFKDK
tara:strand:- start:6255 stop:7238 length:984 start_codon:yes stop_codon:yes gene_type:complete